MAKRSITMPLWYVMVVCTVSMFVVFFGGLSYTRYVDQKRADSERMARQLSDSRWCALMTVLDRAYSTAPGGSEVRQQVATEIHKLVTELGCK